MNTREALPAPAPQEVFCRQHLVFIRHPGRDVPLFRFPALSTGSTAIPYGILRPLVLDACRVLTNRAANGQEDGGDFLASDIQGRDRLEVDDTPLDVDCYYFLGPPEVEDNRNYPIVKTLSAFSFPSTLPRRWARLADALGQQQSYPSPIWRRPAPSEMSTMVGLRDEHRCAITRWIDSCQCAHLIPKAEEAWFVAHNMAIHISEDMSASIDHPSNGILLRADVRLCFDAHGFVFYPGSDPAGDPRFVAYFLQGEYKSLPDLFHRRPATIHPDIPVQFLYARFAYAIINLPRENLLFKSIPKSEKVESIREEMASEKQQRGDLDVSADDEEEEDDSQSYSASSRRSVVSQPPAREEDDAERDRRWRDLLAARIPHLSGLPEVEYPPNTFTGSHAETPHMLRLRSAYIKANPQVWQTSSTSADATREDVEGLYADWFTRPS
ncbi:hypothetical protein V8D89_011059 [Ganoderma adspersum]